MQLFDVVHRDTVTVIVLLESPICMPLKGKAKARVATPAEAQPATSTTVQRKERPKICARRLSATAVTAQHIQALRADLRRPSRTPLALLLTPLPCTARLSSLGGMKWTTAEPQ